MSKQIPIIETNCYTIPAGTTHIRVDGHIIELSGTIDAKTGIITPRLGAQMLRQPAAVQSSSTDTPPAVAKQGA